MKILIIGSQGNLGTQLMKVFSDQTVVGLDRSDVDFLDFNALKERLERESPSIIINAAAYNVVDKCEVDENEKALARRLNVDLPGFLADFCLSSDILFVHYSTDYVFSGDSANSRFLEDCSPSPINFYGQSKADGEQRILKLISSGLKFYLIRTSKLFGPAGSSPFAKPNFFDIMINLAQNGNTLKAVDEEWSCFTFTPDLALATKNIIIDHADYGIFHLINEGVATWYQGAVEALRLKGIVSELVPVLGSTFSRPAKRPMASALENSKRPLLRSWQEALADYLK
ncbi:MAG: NAD(P)-dependent oxidoreductase [Candidatus Falkowbacteria bacterium]|nr:NAD(P)-dependent oxidoreductase [Candidatus Falkowbacteria bacterium]